MKFFDKRDSFFNFFNEVSALLCKVFPRKLDTSWRFHRHPYGEYGKLGGKMIVPLRSNSDSQTIAFWSKIKMDQHIGPTSSRPK
jgi:hypothetical protein